MNYFRVQITSAGLSLDNTEATGQAYNVLAYTIAPVTLLGNVVINPTVSAGFESSFSLRWEANLTLSTFSVVIAGVTMAQDQVNQTGTFSCYYDGTTWSVQYFADGKDQPQAAQGVTDIVVPVGGTKTLVAGVDTAYQRLVGTVTLTSAYTVTAAGGVKAGSQFQIEIDGGITIGANSLTVFGVSINANQALNGGVIIFATYDGVGNWVAASTSRPVSTADIDPVAALSVMGNDTASAATPIDIEFLTNYGVLQRTGSFLTTGLLTSDNFDTSSIVANRVSITTLTSAQILTLGTTPIVIVPASGVNTVNVISSITVTCNFVTTPYDTSTRVSAYYAAATIDYYNSLDLLGFTSSGISNVYMIESGVQEFQLVSNAPILLNAPLGDPMTGDGTIKVTVVYQTIQA
jgi:hypothetical protein